MVDRDKSKVGRLLVPFGLGGQDIIVECSLVGGKVGISPDQLLNPDHYSGPLSFDLIINFGQLFAGMRGCRVPLGEQWSGENPPPEGITILEFGDQEVAEAVKRIAEIAKGNFYDDPPLREEYYKHNQEALRATFAASGVNIEECCFMGLARAGVVAGEMLGVSAEDQILVQTKRLVKREGREGEEEGDVSIGITVLTPGELRKIDGKVLVVPDPAGATYGSILANIINLVRQGIYPRKVVILNTVASHRGAESALGAIRGMGIEVTIIAGGYSPGMNEKYYLETSDGSPSVGDAGDGLNGYWDDISARLDALGQGGFQS